MFAETARTQLENELTARRARDRSRIRVNTTRTLRRLFVGPSLAARTRERPAAGRRRAGRCRHDNWLRASNAAHTRVQYTRAYAYDDSGGYGPITAAEKNDERPAGSPRRIPAGTRRAIVGGPPSTVNAKTR